MNRRTFATVFATVFVAELGDKTQLATLLFDADKEVSKWLVFVAAPMALVAASTPDVWAGSAVSTYVSERALHMVAGIGFVAIGTLTLWK